MIINDNTKLKIDNRMTYILDKSFYQNKKAIKLSTPKNNESKENEIPLFIIKR